MSATPEMLVWKRRIDDANFHREPVYVSPAEWDELKRISPPRPPGPLYDFGARTAYDAFMGTPVVVDAERAAEQRQRAGRVEE